MPPGNSISGGVSRCAVEVADARLDAQVEGYDNVLVLLQAEVATSYIQMRAYEGPV